MALFGLKKKNTGVPHKKVPRTVQESIPYTKVFENGVIETYPDTYTMSYTLNDVNFKIVADEEQVRMFNSYQAFLNQFSPNEPFQIVIRNFEGDRRVAFREIQFAPQRDKLNKYRSDMNKVIFDRVTKGNKALQQEKYLVVSAKEKNPENAMSALDNADIKVKRGLNDLSKDMSYRKASINTRLEQLHSIYNQDDASLFYNAISDDNTPYFDYAKMATSGMTTKDVVGPASMEFKTNYFKLGDIYGKAMFMSTVANIVSTDFISDLSDCPCNMLISIHHQPIETAKAVKKIKAQIMAINGQIAQSQKTAIREGFGFENTNPELTLAQKQTNELLENVVGRDQKFFYVTLVVCVFGKSKEQLDKNTEIIKGVGSRHQCEIKCLDFQQEQGLVSALPLCMNELKVDRMLTTESASIFIPYTTLELHQRGGILYGMNEDSNNIILYNRLLGPNYNGLIFGKSGSGKSFYTKMEMLSVLLRNEKAQVFVIDPEQEYVNLANGMEGQVISLSPGSKTYINPLDMDIADDETDPVSFKADFVVSMLEIMIGKQQTLDATMKSVVLRSVQEIYKGYLQHLNEMRENGSDITCDREAMPTLNQLYNELLRQPEPQAKTAASILEAYVANSFSTFSTRTNTKADSRFVVYDIKNLGTGMKDLGLHICLSDIWNKCLSNSKKGIYTWIYIDEFYLLLQSQSTAAFLMEIWKRARKWLGVPTGIMQNTEDLLRTVEARNIINNTSFITMFNLPKLDRTNLEDLLQIPAKMSQRITQSDIGHGLFWNDSTVLPINCEFPQDTEIYRLLQSQKDIEEEERKKMKRSA